MKALTSIYNIDYQPILHHHTPPPFGHLLYLNVSSMNLSFENHCISNSPSKLEGVGGSMSPHLIVIILLSRSATAPLS